MEITVKCPNCYQSVPKENRYCFFCGYDLAGGAEKVYEERTAFVPPATDAEAADGPHYCPNGHDVLDPTLGFCPICGSPLVNERPVEAAPASKPVEEESPSRRTCSCGYVCEDPELRYCPACGLPLDPPCGDDDSEWKCACGTVNPGDMEFCISCGKPKAWTPEREEAAPSEHAVPRHAASPEGMRPPEDYDLDVKSKYGN